jgi:hypothetical protein
MIEIYPRDERFEELLKLYPPVQANRFLPEWYKKHSVKKRGTEGTSQLNKNVRHAKQCPAIQDYLTHGVIIPAWSDIYLIKDENNLEANWQWNMTIGMQIGDFTWIDKQGDEQIKDIGLNAINDYGVLKLVSPYLWKTPKGYGIYFNDPFYSHRNNIRLLPGYVETDIWHQTNFPFEFLKDLNNVDKKVLFVKAGDPLIQLTPYKIDDVKKNTKFEVKNYDQEFIKKVRNQNTKHSSLSLTWNEYKKY